MSTTRLVIELNIFAVHKNIHSLNSLHGYSQFSSVAQSCPTLCDPMNSSTSASLSITNSWSPPKPMSIESVMPSSHLILCHPLLLLLPAPASIRVFSNESTLHIRWPKCWSFSFNIGVLNWPNLIGNREPEDLLMWFMKINYPRQKIEGGEEGNRLGVSIGGDLTQLGLALQI